MKCGFLLLMASLIALAPNAYGQGSETREKPEKVTSVTMQQKTSDTTQHDVGHGGDTQAARDTVMERDFETIRAAVQSSTTLVVIKALALAVALLGLGFVYLPRKTSEIS
jgi:hypothetical protein